MHRQPIKPPLKKDRVPISKHSQNAWHLFTMNSLRFRLLLLTVLMSIANAQQPASNIFAGKSIEELRRIAEDLGEGKSSFEFVEAAYASGRDDIVAMCWSVRNCGHWCLERLINNKDPEFRDKQLLMMLRNGDTNSFWPDGGGGLLEGGKVGLLIKLNDLVKNHIPDWPANYDVVNGPEKRLAFADKLEALMKAKHAPPAAAPSSSPAAAVPPKPVPVAATPPVEKPKPVTWIPWVSAAAALVLIMGFLVLRARKR